ncbi:hypothetical protein ACNQGC_12530 [Flavobacterium sp. GSP11]|uniref:hypothetical protein n=1 Tax=unclassified Flavobacterium TaxID=196869 RepID=UPI003AAFC244
MDNFTASIETLFERAEDYTRTSAELVKLNAIDKSADVLSSLLSRLTVAIVAVMFVLLINIGLSLWLGEIIGKPYWGFFIVASVYLVVSIILYIFKDQWIKTPISNFIITKLLKKKYEKDKPNRFT